jgi:hypothetical protein
MSLPELPFSRRPAWLVLGTGTLWMSAYLGARFAVESGAPPPWATLAMLLPLPAFVLFVWVVKRALGAADELQRRIQLEALGLAFLVAVAVLMTLGLVALDPSIGYQPKVDRLWALLPPLWGACLGAVNQHYS